MARRRRFRNSSKLGAPVSVYVNDVCETYRSSLSSMSGPPRDMLTGISRYGHGMVDAVECFSVEIVTNFR